MTPNPITLANWQNPEHTVWSYRHIRELIPTARIRHGSPSALARDERDHGRLALQALLDDDRTDGVIALHRGAVVLEEYRRGMRADDVHLLQSISKSITGVLAGILVDRGVLAPEDRVTEHVPELAGSAFDGATVRDLLDMRAGTRFDETYDNPESDVRATEALFGWAPGPRAATDALTYLRTLGNARPHGGRFEYRSILTDVLGIVLERAAKRPFAEALGDELWAPLGTETDACVTVDADGFALADGGICVSLRDLARFGRMIAAGGVVDGRRIVAGSWIDDTLRGGEDSREAFAQDEHNADWPGGHYRNQWWVPSEGVMLGLGIHGQTLFVDHPSETVIAIVSTWPTPIDPDRRGRVLQACRETVRALAADGGSPDS